MKTRFLIGLACWVLLFVSTLLGQARTPFVVLPEGAAEEVNQLCSRPGPPKFQRTWKPTETDIQALESHLSRIAGLRAESGIIGVRIRHPEQYYRQYVGLIIENRRCIFIHAFCDDEPPKYWRENIVDVCDGGSCSWGVVYDIETGKFSHLEMNGIA
jgi:hypothetical protein